MYLVEDIVITAILMFFIGLLSLVAIAAHLWPLWLAVAMLVRAVTILWGWR